MTKPTHPNHFNTQTIHGGEKKHQLLGAAVPPIFQSVTYASGNETRYEDVRYARLNNTPSQNQLHDKLTILEEGAAALTSASGMASITTTFLAFLKQGDKVLLQQELYGGTHSFVLAYLSRWGIDHAFIDVRDPASWEKAYTSNCKLIYVEAIANPMMRVGDLNAVVNFAQAKQLMSIIDATFVTPYNFNPLKVGFDLVIHSATKYLNGHSDIAAGVVVGKKAEHIQEIKRIQDHLGGALDPHACFLLNRGLKTLHVRMQRHNENALALATHLRKDERISDVLYPGLESSQNSFARSLFSGFGGMLSFTLKGQVDTFLSSLQIPMNAPSLGGVESLITCPARTSHAGLSPEDRLKMGVSDGLLRFSVGIEDIGDLIADVDQALDKSFSKAQ